MKSYRVLTRSFIANAIKEEGDIVTEADIKGMTPGSNLEEVDALDHDQDGRKGGSKPRAEPKTEALA
jgi:hypothetical protein